MIIKQNSAICGIRLILRFEISCVRVIGLPASSCRTAANIRMPIFVVNSHINIILDDRYRVQCMYYTFQYQQTVFKMNFEIMCSNKVY